ncbi:MAG: PorT family protein [Prevotellaceae bacterium]|jgi:hypothetical protein|nr:PorT family protein [Prevotellaceae bacterium]
MKKTIFISIFTFFLCVGSMSAQFGVNIGYGLNSFNYSDFGGKQSMNGFSAGISYDLHIQNEWYIFTALNYSQFGRTNTEIDRIYHAKYVYSHGFLEVPVRAAFVMEVLDDLKLSVAVGPKLSYAVFGTKTAKDAAGETEDKIYGKNTASPFGVFAGFNMGAQYTHLRVNIGYDWGILNQYSGIDNNGIAKRSGLLVALSYIF